MPKTGFSFNNYVPPTDGSWGTVATADDMRYSWLFGIDAVAQDLNQSRWEDSQFDDFVDGAIGEFEEYLTIDIRKKIYKTPFVDMRNGTGLEDLVRGAEVGPGVDYTDLEGTYPFIPNHWNRFGFLQLRHYPVISVERAVLNNSIGGDLFDLVAQNWVRISNRDTGQLHFFPSGRTFAYTPFGGGSSIQRLIGYGIRYPDAFEMDYTTGYERPDLVPKGLRQSIAKYAAIKALSTIGDGLLAGFSSQSVSLDGLSESFSSTQSATSAYFGARILQYQKEIDVWLKRNRNKFGAIPMSFAV